MERRLLDLTHANRADGRMKIAHTPYRRGEGRSNHQMSAKRIYSPSRGPAPNREMSQHVAARYGMVPLAMRGPTSFPASAGSSSGILGTEIEKFDMPLGQAKSRAMPSDVLDKLLVIYFTHVHVSALELLCSTADCVESLADHLQASFHSRDYSNTAPQFNALRGGLCSADIRAGPLR